MIKRLCFIMIFLGLTACGSTDRLNSTSPTDIATSLQVGVTTLGYVKMMYGEPDQTIWNPKGRICKYKRGARSLNLIFNNGNVLSDYKFKHDSRLEQENRQNDLATGVIVGATAATLAAAAVTSE